MTTKEAAAKVESYLREDSAFGLMISYYDSWLAQQAAYDVWDDIVHKVLPRQEELGLALNPSLGEQAECTLDHVESVLEERFEEVAREFDLDLSDIPGEDEEDDDINKLGYMLFRTEESSHSDAVMRVVRLLRMRQRAQARPMLS